MSLSVVTATLSDKWDDGQRVHLVGSIAVGASPGTYAAGGLALNFLNTLDGRPGFVPLPGITLQPTAVPSIKGISGYFYEYNLATKKLIIRTVSAVTPAGTNSAPTSTQPSFTVKNGSIGANMTTGLTADATSANFVGGTGITADRTLTTTSPVGTPTISAPAFTGTPVAASALAELATASIPAGVSGDTINFYVIFKKNQ